MDAGKGTRAENVYKILARGRCILRKRVDWIDLAWGRAQW